jgi:hypothetical protein
VHYCNSAVRCGDRAAEFFSGVGTCSRCLPSFNSPDQDGVSDEEGQTLCPSGSFSLVCIRLSLRFFGLE